jgi:predicted Zn-dependent peptidase
METAVKKQSPPPALAPIAFDIPQPFKTKLSNGLEVILFEDKRLPLVSFRLAFQSGDINDPKAKTGLTSAIASMLTEGSENYTSKQLAEKVERLGASLSAHSSDDFTIVSGSALSLYALEVLDLMAETILRPTFPESELDLYRRNTVEHLKFQRSQSPFLAGEQAARLLYGKHPYAVVSPNATAVEGLERDTLAAFQKSTYIPNNAMLVAVGDIERDEFLRELESQFGGWQQGSVASERFTRPPQRDKRTITIVDRTGSAQSNIILGNLAIERTSPDYFPVLVMNQVLGAGASSRIFMNLREEKGYTYGAYTRLNAKRLAGDIEATAEVRNEVTGDSLKEFFYELERIRDEDVREDELADAKSFLAGVFPIRAETQEGLTNLIVNQHLYGLPEDYLQTYRQKVDAVSISDVRAAAEKYVRPAEMAIVIVGDASAVLDQVKPYADSVEIYDTEGNRK